MRAPGRVVTDPLAKGMVSMATPTLRRSIGASVALATALTLAGPLTGASAEPASSASGSTSSAAHYLEQQLAAGGDHFSVEAGGTVYADHGVTADAVLALAAAGTGQAGAAKATAYLREHAADYVTFGTPGDVASGSVAKLLNLTVVQDLDPRDFGGYDLIDTLESLESENGRFSDVSAWRDFSNVLGQSLALIGLERAGVSPSAAAVDFLEAQQCPGGGFQLYMDAPCTDAATSDPDATAFAVQALIAADGDSAAITAGLDFLAAKQGADGGLGGGAPQTAPNANSTGLAGQAFLAGGRTAQAALARGYIERLQYGCTFPPALRGGIAYDPAAFAAQQALGAAAMPVDQDRRSTTQALLALAGTPLYAVSATGATATAAALDCSAPPVTTPGTPGTAPVTGPVIETDLPAEPGVPGVWLGLAALVLLLAGGAATAVASANTATTRRGPRR